MMKEPLRIFITMLVLTSFVASPMGLADVGADVMKMVEEMKGSMKEMQKTIEWQSDKINALEKRGTSGSQPIMVSPTSGGQDLGENYFENNLKSYIGDADKWLKGMKQSGDMRLRYEGQNEEHNRSTTNDRNRFRFRLRYGIEKKLKPDMKVGFRLASGPRVSAASGNDNTGQITSTNQSFDTNFDMKAISIEQVYATYTPEWAQIGPIKSAEITGGKFANPLTAGASLFVWDGDVTPEGLYQRFNIGLLKSDHLNADLDLTSAQFVLEEGSGSEHDDAEMFGQQLGLLFKIKGIFPKTVDVKSYLSYYDYNDFNLVGNFQATNGNFTRTTAGGTEITNDFNMLIFHNEVAFDTFNFLPKLTLYHEHVQNLAEANTAFTSGKDDINKAWSLGASLGKVKKKGQWALSYDYGTIAANAVPGVFSDSDFGGADRRGSIIRAAYGLTDNLQLNTALFLTNRDLVGNPSRPDNQRQLIQVDLVWKI